MVIREDCNCPFPIHTEIENVYLGKKVILRLCCLAKAVEKITGEKFLFIEKGDYPQEDWDENEEKKFQTQERLRKAWKEHKEKYGEKDLPPCPPPYKKKPMPSWIKKRLNK